jgi:spermidine/putrescine transport system permease protein
MPRSTRTAPIGMSLLHRLFGLWTALILSFLYLPITLLVIYSFNASRLNIVWQGFTFDWYRQLFNNKPLIDSLNNSLIIASITTLLSVLLGTAAAWLLYRYRLPMGKTILSLIYIPIVIPEIIMGVSLLILFATLSRNLGLPLKLGFLTVILSHVTFCFPFVMVTIQARLAGIDPSLEEAAMDLGATPWRAFWLVILPYLLPAIISGALMSFTLSMDELIVTYFTTGPQSITLPIKVFGMAKVGLNPMLNAVSAVFIVGTALLIAAAEYLRRPKETP